MCMCMCVNLRVCVCVSVSVSVSVYPSMFRSPDQVCVLCVLLIPRALPLRQVIKLRRFLTGTGITRVSKDRRPALIKKFMRRLETQTKRYTQLLEATRKRAHGQVCTMMFCFFVCVYCYMCIPSVACVCVAFTLHPQPNLRTH